MKKTLTSIFVSLALCAVLHADRYVVQANTNVVLDTATGLMWTRDAFLVG